MESVIALYQCSFEATRKFNKNQAQCCFYCEIANLKYFATEIIDEKFSCIASENLGPLPTFPELHLLCPVHSESR